MAVHQCAFRRGRFEIGHIDHKRVIARVDYLQDLRAIEIQPDIAASLDGELWCRDHIPGIDDNRLSVRTREDFRTLEPASLKRLDMQFNVSRPIPH